MLPDVRHAKIHQLRRASFSSSGRLEAGRKRKQGDVTRLLDRLAQTPLVPCANARQTARNDLASLGDKLLQQANVTVRDRIDLLRAELADLLAAEELPSARSASARTTRATARTRPAGAGRASSRSGLLLRLCAVVFVSHFSISSQVRCAYSRSRHATLSLDTRLARGR
jgi:hypothetical protein